MTIRTLIIGLAVFVTLAGLPRTSAAQAAGAPDAPEAAAPAPETGTSSAAAQVDPAATAFNAAQPEFTLVNLPTTLRLQKYKSAFRVTHRFARPLGAGDFGDLVSDFFGIDSGALIGLEYRFAPINRAQVGIHRTNAKTIEFFGQYNLVTQGDAPVTVDALVTIDGTNNFRDSYTPAVGAIVSRLVGDVAALYVTPMWVNNSNPLPSEVVDDNDSFALGLGARVRIARTVSLVAEALPRLSGFEPGTTAIAFGIEKRVNRHLFQLHFGNYLGSTMGNLVRGAANNDDWYLGFNINRKF